MDEIEKNLSTKLFFFFSILFWFFFFFKFFLKKFVSLYLWLILTFPNSHKHLMHRMILLEERFSFFFFFFEEPRKILF